MGSMLLPSWLVSWLTQLLNPHAMLLLLKLCARGLHCNDLGACHWRI